MKGFINIIKPSGKSSAMVVNVVKKKFHLPCGHMGTLDPLACGILPIGIGKTSRLFPYLLDKTKKYISTFAFGYETDTLDVTGKIVKSCKKIPNIDEIEAALKNFIGKIKQFPPKFSAKNFNGKKGYELARKGIDFSVNACEVEIISFSLIDKICENKYKFEIICKAGTYIRSLARDLGYACGSLATMETLDRVQCGEFNYSNAVKFDDFLNSESPEEYLISPQSVLNFDSIVLTNAEALKILNGVFDYKLNRDGFFKVFNEKEFWGIGISENGVLKIKSYVR